MTSLIPTFFLCIQSSGSQEACLLYIRVSFSRSSPEGWLALFKSRDRLQGDGSRWVAFHIALCHIILLRNWKTSC